MIIDQRLAIIPNPGLHIELRGSTCINVATKPINDVFAFVVSVLYSRSSLQGPKSVLDTRDAFSSQVNKESA